MSRRQLKRSLHPHTHYPETYHANRQRELRQLRQEMATLPACDSSRTTAPAANPCCRRRKAWEMFAGSVMPVGPDFNKAVEFLFKLQAYKIVTDGCHCPMHLGVSVLDIERQLSDERLFSLRDKIHLYRELRAVGVWDGRINPSVHKQILGDLHTQVVEVYEDLRLLLNCHKIVNPLDQFPLSEWDNDEDDDGDNASLASSTLEYFASQKRQRNNYQQADENLLPSVRDDPEDFSESSRPSHPTTEAEAAENEFPSADIFDDLHFAAPTPGPTRPLRHDSDDEIEGFTDDDENEAPAPASQTPTPVADRSRQPMSPPSAPRKPRKQNGDNRSAESPAIKRMRFDASVKRK